mmetsp:Transcript_24081/g.67009  ORF Transcript_24081/g.67009 Transcript_24081/m.67009 type:complete len:183 (-) Transcript_24081:44-592(-)
MPVWDQLPSQWADLCRSAGTATFSWAHDGQSKNGWVELKENGVLSTYWCEGTWRVSSDPDVIEMSFGSSRHICRLRDSGFVVEDKYLLRSGKQNLKSDAPRSCGWIKTSSAPVRRGAARPLRRRPDGDEEDEADANPSFNHADLSFDVFLNAWAEPRNKRHKLSTELGTTTEAPLLAEGVGA